MFDGHMLNEIFRSEQVHQLSKGVFHIPHTSGTLESTLESHSHTLEPLSQNEIIVIGGDSWSSPNTNADSVIMDNVRKIKTSCDLFQISDFQHRDEA